jgi:hypothetical protein
VPPLVGGPRVRLHCRLRDRGTEHVRLSAVPAMKRVGSSTAQSGDAAEPWARRTWTSLITLLIWCAVCGVKR